MENALLVGLSRQIALAREIEVIANNVANIGTTGFKSRSLRFEEYLDSDASADAFKNLDRPVSFTVDKQSGLNFTAGPVEFTGNPFDVAIQGDGLFAVATPQGERYTRNGAFQLNNAGELVTSDGHRVLGDGGPFVFSAAEKGMAIASDGTVSSDQGPKGRLRIVTVDPQALTNVGANLYSTTAAPAPASLELRLASGALERSNVQPVLEMSRLIEVNRAYSSVSTMLQRTDELRKSAIERLASVPA
jgi:flagellar basal-body rod protein FlgF